MDKEKLIIGIGLLAQLIKYFIELQGSPSSHTHQMTNILTELCESLLDEKGPEKK